MLSKGQITPLCTLQYFLGVGVWKSEGENWMNTQHREYGQGQTSKDLGCSRWYHTHIIHEDLFSYRLQTGHIKQILLNLIFLIVICNV